MATLVDLPPELLVRIFRSGLSVSDVGRLCAAGKFVRACSEDDVVWRCLYCDLTGADETKLSQTCGWKSIVRQSMSPMRLASECRAESTSIITAAVGRHGFRVDQAGGVLQGSTERESFRLVRVAAGIGCRPDEIELPLTPLCDRLLVSCVTRDEALELGIKRDGDHLNQGLFVSNDRVVVLMFSHGHRAAIWIVCDHDLRCLKVVFHPLGNDHQVTSAALLSDDTLVYIGMSPDSATYGLTSRVTLLHFSPSPDGSVFCRASVTAQRLPFQPDDVLFERPRPQLLYLGRRIYLAHPGARTVEVLSPHDLEQLACVVLDAVPVTVSEPDDVVSPRDLGIQWLGCLLHGSPLLCRVVLNSVSVGDDHTVLLEVHSLTTGRRLLHPWNVGYAGYPWLAGGFVRHGLLVVAVLYHHQMLLVAVNSRCEEVWSCVHDVPSNAICGGLSDVAMESCGLLLVDHVTSLTTMCRLRHYL